MGFKKKVFTEFKYVVICGIVFDLLAKVFNLSPTPTNTTQNIVVGALRAPTNNYKLKKIIT
jgi:hypothetical protein